MMARNREYSPAWAASKMHGLAEAAAQVEQETLEQMVCMVIIKPSTTPNIVGSEFSQENELCAGARKAVVHVVMNGKLYEGTTVYAAKEAIRVVREVVLTGRYPKGLEEFRIVVTLRDSPEKLSESAANLARYRRSRIRMPKVADLKQTEMTDDQLREYLRLAQQRTRDRRKLRGGN
jgi:hypothetical protein